MNNQNGFATLEIILIVGIIAIFSTIAVPKMARILDKVALNYEMKHLYSELNLARSIGKSSNFHGGIFPDFKGVSGEVELWLYSKAYSKATVRNRYQIVRVSSTATENYFRHSLQNGITFSFDMSNEYHTPLKISGYKSGKSRTITLTSKFGDKAYIYLDTVWRVSGDYVKRY